MHVFSLTLTTCLFLINIAIDIYSIYCFLNILSFKNENFKITMLKYAQDLIQKEIEYDTFIFIKT